MAGVEFLHQPDERNGVPGTGGLVAGVHGQLRQADVHAVHGYLRHGKVAQSAAADFIGTVGKILQRDTGAGIVYLCGDGYQAAIHTVVNALAIVSGIVCDGAKASCAAKIASSVDAALLGYNMYKCHQEFKGGDGIVMKDIETTIKGIGRLGKDGMKETNEEIIRLMIE